MRSCACACVCLGVCVYCKSEEHMSEWTFHPAKSQSHYASSSEHNKLSAINNNMVCHHKFQFDWTMYRICRWLLSEITKLKLNSIALTTTKNVFYIINFHRKSHFHRCYASCVTLPNHHLARHSHDAGLLNVSIVWLDPIARYFRYSMGLFPRRISHISPSKLI